MKGTEAKILQMLGAVSQFIIPIYQYTYSWTRKECEQPWADSLRAGASNANRCDRCQNVETRRLP